VVVVAGLFLTLRVLMVVQVVVALRLTVLEAQEIHLVKPQVKEILGEVVRQGEATPEVVAAADLTLSAAGQAAQQSPQPAVLAVQEPRHQFLALR
jgi:hypothetical protein